MSVMIMTSSVQGVEVYESDRAVQEVRKPSQEYSLTYTAITGELVEGVFSDPYLAQYGGGFGKLVLLKSLIHIGKQVFEATYFIG